MDDKLICTMWKLCRQIRIKNRVSCIKKAGRGQQGRSTSKKGLSKEVALSFSRVMMIA